MSSSVRFLAEHRLTASRLFIIPMVVLARPSAQSLGGSTPLILLGILFRTWAASTVLKNGPSPSVTGAYAMCRHPLYLGTFLQGLGWCLAARSLPLVLAYLAFFCLFYIPTMVREETHLQEKFPDSYPWFQRSVPAFVPNPFRVPRSLGKVSLQRFRENREIANYGINLFLLGWFLFRLWYG